MDADTYSNAGVIEFSNGKFVNVHVNTDKGSPVAEKFEVTGIPVTFLVTPEGEKVATWPGYVGPKDYQDGVEKAVKAHANLRDVEAKLKAKPDDRALLLEAAGHYEALSKTRDAADHFRKAAKGATGKELCAALDKSMEQVYRIEGAEKELLELAGELEKADADGKLGFKDNAANARAVVATREEKWDEALKLFEGVVASWPDGDKAPLALFWQAFIWHEGKKDNKKAEALLKALMEKYPKSEEAGDAKGFLEHMKKHSQ